MTNTFIGIVAGLVEQSRSSFVAKGGGEWTDEPSHGPTAIATATRKKRRIEDDTIGSGQSVARDVQSCRSPLPDSPPHGVAPKSILPFLGVDLPSPAFMGIQFQRHPPHPSQQSEQLDKSC